MSKRAIVETLFDVNEYEAEAEWVNDDYETPDGSGGSVRLAQAIASLVNGPGDRTLECSAGTGRIAQFLRPGATCIEINPDRVAEGKERAPEHRWIEGNFLKSTREMFGQSYSTIVTNPPFSLAMDFVAHAKTLLRPKGQLLLLLPGDYFCAKGVADRAEELGVIFHHKYMIRGRVDYLKSDVRIKGRMIHDAVFDLRFGRSARGCSILRV